MPVSKPYLKASIKSITRLELPSVEGNSVCIFTDPISRISGSRYMMCLTFEHMSHILIVEVDINTMATRPLVDVDLPNAVYMISRNNYIMYVSSDSTSIIKDG